MSIGKAGHIGRVRTPFELLAAGRLEAALAEGCDLGRNLIAAGFLLRRGPISRLAGGGLAARFQPVK